MTCETCGCTEHRQMASPRQKPRMRQLLTPLLLLILGLLSVVAAVRWHTHFEQYRLDDNGDSGGYGLVAANRDFNLSNSLVPERQILSGGPPKDGIPSITSPEHVAPSEIDLADNQRVIGVSINGENVAYPLALLNWHECVNDVVGGIPIAVTYCPLCDSVAVIDRRIDDDVVEFGISGRLYNSNVLLYDRRRASGEESLWSQVQGRAIAGPMAGTTLKTLPFELTLWDRWRDDHPDGLVTAFPDPPQRAYSENPYSSYFADPGNLMFPVEPLSDRLGVKERVLGLTIGEESVAVPLNNLAAGERSIPIGGQTVTVEWDPLANGLRIISAPANVQVVHTFWFAWGAMHPDTDILELN